MIITFKLIDDSGNTLMEIVGTWGKGDIILRLSCGNHYHIGKCIKRWPIPWIPSPKFEEKISRVPNNGCKVIVIPEMTISIIG